MQFSIPAVAKHFLFAALLVAFCTPSVAGPRSGPNQPVFDSYVRTSVLSLPGSSLPLGPGWPGEDDLIDALYHGLPTLVGLTPAEGWCGAAYRAYRSCDDGGGTPSTVFMSSGPAADPDCQAPGASARQAVEVLAAAELVAGSMATYFVFYTSAGSAQPVAYRITELGASFDNLPSVVCSSSANSTGQASELFTQGPPSIGYNDFTLRAWQAIPGSSAVFVYGGLSPAAPFGDGTLCVGGTQGLHRLGNPQVVAGNGEASIAVDFTAPLPATISAGSTWYFQLWYRDSAAGGTGFNLSSTLEVAFCP